MATEENKDSTIFNSNEGADEATTSEAPESNSSTSSNDEATTSSDQNVEEKSSSPSFELPNEAKEFVGEGKKYSSIEDALKSVPHAQRKIQTMEEKMEQLEAELQKRKAAEEVYEQFSKKADQREESTNSEPAVSEEDIARLVESKLTQREQMQIAQRNTQEVVKALEGKFGDKAEEQYVNQAKELGVSVDYMNTLAAQSPKAALRIFGIDNNSTSNGPQRTDGGLNTEAFETNNPKQTQHQRVPLQGATTKDLVNAWKSYKPTE